ncbi:GntR family transcriptional regulator YhfZ [Clostridium gasigenes]|uniref:GntR family transcriptional regulator YhfZ n=1 Tax=Clostridium gasigenes TaxID=94869 RepID=UPI001C0A9A6A|nr:GntR family transcriptional regulator YhfZ [Clostridium gasigenes]MBU3103580.1 hypothetical protein [Clostridium gasigenes]MBU3133073.1 hypothetical protein [Clostridium gasigenes]
MDIKKSLMQKNGIIVMALAEEFFSKNIGDRIDTVGSISEKYETSRGTVQTAIKILQEQNLIAIESRGHLGSFITHLDYNALIALTGIDNIVGVMPLPYSKKYEGLATGISETMKNMDIPFNFAFMRGGNNRLESLIRNRYDFAITSMFTAKHYIDEEEDIEIVTSFGKNTYVDNHGLIFRKETDIKKDDFKVGIDYSSKDQVKLTLNYFNERKVQLVSLKYNQLINSIENKEIDGAIWTIDENIKSNENLNYVLISDNIYNMDDTEAVIIIKKDNKLIKELINKFLDANMVLEKQRQVIAGEIIPQY